MGRRLRGVLMFTAALLLHTAHKHPERGSVRERRRVSVGIIPSSFSSQSVFPLAAVPGGHTESPRHRIILTMMMHEPEERAAEEPQGRTTLDLPLLSRDDNTWEQFQGANIVGDTALRGMTGTQQRFVHT